MRLVLAALLSLSIAACKSNREATVEGVWVAQASQIEPLPKIARIVVTKNAKPIIAKAEGDVALVLDRDVLWSQVQALREKLVEQGRHAYLVVANGRNVGTFNLYDELKGVSIRVFVQEGGKLCVSPPNTPEAKCVQRLDKVHVDEVFTRELVREAVKGYQLHDVRVEVPADLGWADVVRAIDGARTCCFKEEVRVRLVQSAR